MKTKMKHIEIALLPVLIFIFFSFTLKGKQNNEWKTPEYCKKLQNDVPCTKENLLLGKALYRKHCNSCHGEKGEADGIKATKLDSPPAKFVVESFCQQTDGEIFYKISQGRGDMGSYKKKLSKEDRWLIVNYVRSLEVK
ncbi:MAG: cytochrome c [Bacteroidetes bacterium]|nr:cytochrome c [Bacteroidota bacterium]